MVKKKGRLIIGSVGLLLYFLRQKTGNEENMRDYAKKYMSRV